MTKQITKEEAIKALDKMKYYGVGKECNLLENVVYFQDIKQYLEQDEVEAKSLEEIEEEFIDDFINQVLHVLDYKKEYIAFIKQACISYAASKDKEIEQLRADLSEMANKLELNK